MENPLLNLEDIKRILPHRFPFLLLDRVLELEEGKRCKAIKNVTGNEIFFEGHFPGNPIMPGVLIVEAMAQAAGIAAFSTVKDPSKYLVFFAGIEKARFKNPVMPGDQLIIESECLVHKMSIPTCTRHWARQGCPCARGCGAWSRRGTPSCWLRTPQAPNLRDLLPPLGSSVREYACASLQSEGRGSPALSTFSRV